MPARHVMYMMGYNEGKSQIRKIQTPSMMIDGEYNNAIDHL
jgi:hypothetical protein